MHSGDSPPLAGLQTFLHRSFVLWRFSDASSATSAARSSVPSTNRLSIGFQFYPLLAACFGGSDRAVGSGRGWMSKLILALEVLHRQPSRPTADVSLVFFQHESYAAMICQTDKLMDAGPGERAALYPSVQTPAGFRSNPLKRRVLTIRLQGEEMSSA